MRAVYPYIYLLFMCKLDADNQLYSIWMVFQIL